MSDEESEAHEPAITVPWPALVLTGVILFAYLVQSGLGAETLALRYGFAPADLDQGRLITLITYQFLHGGWAHAGMNAVWCLAFAPPVSRLLGQGPAGALALLVFYLVCGALAALGYGLFHMHEAAPLVGASGAVAGLMGAASRLVRGQGVLAPLRDRGVATMGIVWIGINIVLGLIGFAPGMGKVTIAWEAHIAGYAAGLLLIGPAAHLIRRGRYELTT